MNPIPSISFSLFSDKCYRTAILLSLFFATLAFKSFAQPVAKFSFTRSSTCIKPGDAIIVGFRDESIGDAHSTEWAFGDGGTSNNANPTWTYTAAGVYYVTLTIRTQANEISSVTQQIVIFPLQEVNFVADVSAGCTPLKVVLTDLTKDLEIKDPISGFVYKEKISSRQWVFGDGLLGTSETASISHTYTKPGIREVGLTILYESGCSVFKQSPKSFINAYQPAFSDFYFPPPITCQYPVSIQSINNSTNAVAYKWSVQGPSPVTISNDTDPNPSFSFQQSGTYKIKLIATTADGCSDEKTLDYYLPPTNISASFSSIDSACANTTIKFTNTSIPDPIDNKWFVNGVQVGNQKDFSNYFSTAGSFVVKLEVQIGACSASSEKTIRINPLPSAKFSADTLESCSFPFTVNFFDSSTGPIVRRVWEFGDGTSQTEKPPYANIVPHTYSREGVFSIKLSVFSDRNCADQKYVPNLISIQLPRVIKANLPDSGCVPFKVSPLVKFANENEITSWQWDYTDLKGNVIFSTSGPTPESYTFTDSGRYLVKLKIATVKGCDRSFSWSVKAGYVPKDFDFTATPKDSCASINFKFQYLGDVATGFKWFFNGMDSVLERDPMKKFKKLGPVNVKLIVYQYGCAKELTKNAFVNVKGVISSFSSLDDCAKPLDRLVLDNSVGNIENWLINYGDGTIENYTSRRDTLSHTYSKSGQYTISLKVAGDGCDYVDSIKMNVADERKLDFTVGKLPVCVTDTFMNLFSVVDNPRFIKTYNWDLGCDFTGQGGASFLKVPLSSLCKFSSNGGRGMYSMRLRIVDTNNCVITSPVKDIFVGGPIVGYAALTPITGCANLPVNFKDNTTGDGFNQILSKSWDFGDGTAPQNILSGPVSHVFSSVGTFPVTLTVTDAAGCSSKKSTVSVITSDPDLDFISFDTASCPDKTIQLEAKSSALLSSYFWKLDEGKTSAAPNPRVSYSITGQKTISLTVKDLLGCEKTITRPNYLYIDVPSAEFVSERDTADCPPYNAGFLFKGRFAESYSWDFGDGNSSTLKDPRHLYMQSGNYPVSLTVTSPGGCIATTTKPLVLVVNGPRGSVSYKPALCEPFNAQFNITHIKSNHVLIDYGDGNISDTLPVADQFSYAYADTGFYQPKIFLLNDAGCRVLLASPSGIRTVSIEPKFTPDINFLCDNGTISFTDRTYSNETLTNWKWDFGNGKTGTGSKVVTYYDRPGFYSVKLNVGSQSGCFDSLTRTSIIEVQARPDIAISSSKATICEDDIIQFQSYEATPNNSPVVSWFWDFANGNSSDLQNPLPQQFRKVGTYPLRLYVTNSKGCSDTLSQNFIVNANPQVDAGPDINFCLGTPIKITAKGASTYQWQPAPGISCLNCPDPSINPVNDVVYIVKGFSLVGCSAMDSLNVRVVKPSTVTTIRDTFVCAGESIQLFSSGTELYSWSPSAGLSKSDVAAPIARPSQTTTYTVTGRDPYNCFVTKDDVTINVVGLPKVDAGPDTTVMAGYPFTTRPTYSNDVARVQWVPSTFLNCSDCKFPVATPAYSATYTLFAYTQEGCMSKDVVNVFVTCTKENLFIPNTFSPNGDGQNEIFYPRGRGIEKIKSMKLFSRWGQLVYQKTNFFANDQSAGWDGRKSGQFVTPDVYVYMIDLVCENGTIITLKGDVTLVR